MANKGPALPRFGEMLSNVTEQEIVCPEWKVSGVFSSHMVLQRDVDISVHGWCNHPGAGVEGEWDGQVASCQVAADGGWKLVFPPHAASYEPTRMTVRSAYGEDVFEDVLVGDVWLLGGQSNMDLSLECCIKETPEIDATISGDDPFRLFLQTQEAAAAHALANNIPERDVISPDWQWRRPDREAALPFSALGYYVARRLAPKVGVPLGFIMAAAGGACLRELMSEELAHRLGHRAGANVPLAGYYNALIAPLLGMQFRGQIFFQGESEGCWFEPSLTYDRDLAAYVADERQRFGIDFPFYNIQLSCYREEGKTYFPNLHWVRLRQYSAKQIIPGYHLTVDRDLGSRPEDADFAHSLFKDALAARVAGQILANEYGIGEAEAAESPSPVSMEDAPEGVLVKFACVNGGLKTADGGKAVTGFGVLFGDARNAEGTLVEAEIVDAEHVLVHTPECRRPSRLQYAAFHIAGMTEANLMGGTGLPVPAFEM